MSSGMMSFQKVSVAGLVVVVLVSAFLPAWAVTGGAPVAEGEAPWMVALVDTSRSADPACLESGGSELFCKQFCGGVLITPSWVLTAAHCVDASLGSVADLRLVMGGAELNDPLAEVAIAAEKVVHVNHDPAPTFDNDIALIRLSSPAASATASLFSETGYAAFESSAGSLNDEVQLFGYGRLATSGAFAATLQQVAFDIQEDAVCEAVYNDAQVVTYFPDLMLCVAEPDAESVELNDAGSLDPADPDGEDACTYDSGGPLLGRSENGLRVAGLVSFGDKSNCGDPDRPSVYTQVEAYLPWLETVSASASVPVGDLGLDMIVTDSAAPGTPETVTVTLSNGSANTVYGMPSFAVSVAGGASLSLSDPGYLACAEMNGVFTCDAPSDMQAGNQLSATFSLIPASVGDEVAFLTASVVSSGPEDYRADNDEVRHRVVFSDKPNLMLEVEGLVTEVSENGGKVHVFVTVSNSSASATASSVDLSLVPPNGEDYSLFWSEGSICAGSPIVTCPLGDVGPGDSTSFRLELLSSAREDGEIQLTASTTSGDYPSADTSRVEQVVFREVLVQSPAPGTGHGSSGGGMGPTFFGLMMLALLRWQQCPPR